MVITCHSAGASVRLALEEGAQLDELVAAAAEGLGTAAEGGSLHLAAPGAPCTALNLIQSIREVRAGDVLGFLSCAAEGAGAGESRGPHGAHPNVAILPGGGSDDEAGDESDGSGESEDSAEVEVTCEATAEEARAIKLAAAQAEGRQIDLTLDDSDDDGGAPAGAAGGRGRGRGRGGRGGPANAKGAVTMLARVLSSRLEVSAALGAASDQAEAHDDPEQQKVKTRATNMLLRGLHAATPEAEAKTAMKLAERLLRQYNLSQAALLADADAQASKAPSSLAGGSAGVELVNPKTNTGINISSWMTSAAFAAAKSFDARYYTERYQYERTTCFQFYGVASGAQMAAIAFAAAFNRIVAMGQAHAPSAAEYAKLGGAALSGMRSLAAFTREARDSYRCGLAAGLLEGVRAAKAERAERERRRLATARAKASSGEAWRESDDDDDDDDDDAGGGADHDGARAEPKAEGEAEGEGAPGAPKEEEEAKSGAPAGGKAAAGAQDASAVLAKLERAQSDAHALVLHTERVYTEQLKAVGITKLRAGRKRKSGGGWGMEGHFHDGKRDAKQIDLQQRGIDLKDIKGL